MKKITIGVFGEPKSGTTRTAVCIGQYLKKAGIKKVAIIDDDGSLVGKDNLPEGIEVTIITAGVKQGQKEKLIPNRGEKRYL